MNPVPCCLTFQPEVRRKLCLLPPRDKRLLLQTVLTEEFSSLRAELFVVKDFVVRALASMKTALILTCSR